MPDTTTKRNYKKTLNLPKTSFPMRANLAQNEPVSLKRWEKDELYSQVLDARSEAEPFVFHDGPPYANASLHVGHLLNKVLKDIVVRSRNLAGRQCPFVPGWDCHGLPIEHHVMTKLIESGKSEKIDSLSEDDRRMAIRRECAKHAKKSIKVQSNQLKRMLTLADYDEPYLTMNPRYEAAVLEVFAQMLERGLVYRDLKPVHWSIANQTALAEAELEYQQREDISIYVNFEAADRDEVAKTFGVELDQSPCFMIWTTTPWTLPANLAIAVHPRYRYSLVEVDGNITVLAGDLVERVTQAAEAEKVTVLGECDGADLIGLTYHHPFVESAREEQSGRLGEPGCHRVVAAEYVTFEDGTGLVHTAPGHGTEDYQTGQREGLPIYCPVRGDGTFDDTAPDWLQGKSVWEANELVTEHLRESGHLFYDHTFVHSYPHDWRSKTPVIFRATKQWFVAVGDEFKVDESDESASLRDRALRAADSQIEFIPKWGRNRMRGMLESRPDWCLSRQRAWGLPIPAFENENGEVLLTPASVRAVAKVITEKGSDAWFTEPPDVLLSAYDEQDDPMAARRSGPAGQQMSSHKREHSSGSESRETTWSKMYDIFDVWFESGSSWNAVLNERALGYPADLYLEGSDQHRGWFQLSLLPGLSVTGQSPFLSVLTHGFMVDRDGKKMSKSGGNALNVDELLEEFGADVCRWWVSSLACEGDIKVDLEFFKLASESYRKVRNTLRFLLSNLQDFIPCTEEKPDGMCVPFDMIPPESIDGYALGEAVKLEAAVMHAYEKYQFRKVHQLIYDFCNETMSAVYCAAAKDRLYCDPPDSERRRRTQSVMWEVLEVLARALAPIMPHTADETYRALWNDDRTIHTRGETGFEYEAHRDWPKVMAMREAVLKALEDAKPRGIENPLDAEVVIADPGGLLKPFEPDLADLFGVSRVQVVARHSEPAEADSQHAEPESIRINDLRNEPRCERSWKRDGTVKQREDTAWLTDRDAQALAKQM